MTIPCHDALQIVVLAALITLVVYAPGGGESNAVEITVGRSGSGGRWRAGCVRAPPCSSAGSIDTTGDGRPDTIFRPITGELMETYEAARRVR